MLKCGVSWSVQTDAYRSGKESADKALSAMGEKACFVLSFCTVDYDESGFMKGVREVLGNVPVMGATSFSGILTPGGFIHSATGAGAVMALSSPDVVFGVGAAEIGQDPRDAGQKAVREAIAQAGKSESDPVSAFILMAAPGAEERIIKGIQDVVGRVPMIGGSAGNQGGEAPWKEFANDRILTNGAAVGVMYSRLPFGISYTGYYKPTDKRGVITKVRDRRILVEINGRKAMEVYAEWRGVRVDELAGGELLMATIPYPLGRQDVGGDLWWIIHPINGNEDGSMATGSDLAEGTAVTMMQASLDEVARGASELIKMTLEDLRAEAGVVILGHCAGRAMAIGTEAMEKVTSDIKSILGDTPFLGFCTFGEQGYGKWTTNGAGGLMLVGMALGK
jgi:hypothetical protein